ncbi:MAG: tRNA uridine-5-carboxymethylaminomethyl(34) synthesis GTPase MnmE, partial [Clostridiales bacterium]|nr:tRNA uridine-5-carboxymethylaminomethyl(34) synthesis GTPase MnmE [Clostridiales bacterium]
MPDDTIAAIATPEGVGGIAIVRISGPGSGAVLLGAFRPAGSAPVRPRQLRLGWAIDGQGQPIDEAMAVFFPSPHSYTRE